MLFCQDKIRFIGKSNDFFILSSFPAITAIVTTSMLLWSPLYRTLKMLFVGKISL